MANPESIELAFNLWYRVNAATSAIIALYGKAYGLRGTDESKLATLRDLARSDFVTARAFRVPERFSIVLSDGTSIKSTHASVARDPSAHLFEEVMAALEADVPAFAVFRGEEPSVTRLRSPRNPLAVRTCLMDTDDGQVHPVTG